MVYEITTLEQFRQVKVGAVGYIGIVDNKNQEDDKIHFPFCSTVTEEGFQKKVLYNRNGNGRYFYSDTLAEAKTEFGARGCKKCKPES